MRVSLGDEFWKERIEVRKAEIAELKDRVAELEAQLGIALDIMFDSQIADFQEQCENKVHISNSDTTKQPE